MKPSTPLYDEAVAEFIKRNGVTQCPTVYLEPTQAAKPIAQISPGGTGLAPLASNNTHTSAVRNALRTQMDAFGREVWRQMVELARARGMNDPSVLGATEVANAFNEQGFLRRTFLLGQTDHRPWSPNNISNWRRLIKDRKLRDAPQGPV